MGDDENYEKEWEAYEPTDVDDTEKKSWFGFKSSKKDAQKAYMLRQAKESAERDRLAKMRGEKDAYMFTEKTFEAPPPDEPAPRTFVGKLKKRYHEIKGDTYEPVKEEAKRAYDQTAGRVVGRAKEEYREVKEVQHGVQEKYKELQQTRPMGYAGKAKDIATGVAGRATRNVKSRAVSESTNIEFFKRKKGKWTKKDSMSKYGGLRRNFGDYSSPTKAKPNISYGIPQTNMTPTLQPRSEGITTDFLPKFNPVSVGPLDQSQQELTGVKAMEYEMRDLKDKIRDMNRIKRNPELYQQFGGEEFDLQIRAYKKRLSEVRRWKNQLNREQRVAQSGMQEDQPLSPYFVSVASPPPAYMGVRGQMVARQRVYEETNKSKIGDGFMAGTEGLAPYMFGGVRGGVKFGTDFSSISPTVQLKKKEDISLAGGYTGAYASAGTSVRANSLSQYLAKPRTTNIFNAIPKSQGKTISVSRGVPRSNSAASKGNWNFGSLEQYVIKGRRKKK